MERKEVKKLLENLEECLQTFAEENGVIIEVNGANYSALEINPRVKIVPKSEGESDEEALKKAFESKSILVGADPEWFGKEILVNNGNTKAKVIKIEERKRKYPIIVKADNGDAWKLSVDQVKSRIG